MSDGCAHRHLDQPAAADVPGERRKAAFAALPLQAIDNAPATKRQRSKRLPLQVLDSVLMPIQVEAQPVGISAESPLYEQVMLLAACN